MASKSRPGLCSHGAYLPLWSTPVGYIPTAKSCLLIGWYHSLPNLSSSVILESSPFFPSHQIILLPLVFAYTLHGWGCSLSGYILFNSAEMLLPWPQIRVNLLFIPCIIKAQYVKCLVICSAVQPIKA